MKRKKTGNKSGFTLLEIIVVVAILVVLAAVLVPMIGGMVESTNQAADNANARMLYNSAALWFSENLRAEADLTPADLADYLAENEYPAILSGAFHGEFRIAVTVSGYIEVRTADNILYDPSTGKLTID